jgi:hypothetical protein
VESDNDTSRRAVGKSAIAATNGGESPTPSLRALLQAHPSPPAFVPPSCGTEKREHEHVRQADHGRQDVDADETPDSMAVDSAGRSRDHLITPFTITIGADVPLMG